jgi:hypothetical protein
MNERNQRFIEWANYDAEIICNPFFFFLFMDLEKARDNPPLQRAIERYQEIVRGWSTEEMLKGQAFGL